MGQVIRQYEIKHYGGLFVDMPITLPYGDTYFAEDMGMLYKYNNFGSPIPLNTENPLNFTQSVDNYSLLQAGDEVGELAYVKNEQGTKWLPGTIGGTYYPSGIYVWDGALWNSDRNSIAEAFHKIDLRTGWASYVDTQYTQGAPFQILAGVPTKLPNNAGNVIDSQLPAHVTNYWDSTAQKVIGHNNDGMDMMLYWKAIPSAQNAELKIWLDIGLTNLLYEETKNFRGTEPKGVLYSLPSAYNLGTWTANGADVFVESNVNMGLYGMTFNFDTTHKGR